MGSERAENILFIPGFIAPTTQSFGSYPQIPGGEGEAWFVDPNWDPNNIQDFSFLILFWFFGFKKM